MSLKRGFSDQTSIFGPKVGNIVIYRPYVLHNTEVQINYGNTKVTKNKLYRIYGLCLGN